VDDGGGHQASFVTADDEGADEHQGSRWDLIGRWRAAKRGDRAWWVGLAAVAMLLAGSGFYQVWAVPPYRYTDEQAHIGYVLELQDGRLPSIDTPIDGAEGGPELQQRLELTRNRHGEVWVANNPPLAYVIDIAPAAATRALGWPGGPLVGMRLANLAFMAAAAVLVARLGTQLSGDDRRVGLVAAGIFAAIPHVGMIAGTAYNDGLGLLCSVGMLDTLVSISRRGPTRRQIITLAVWCAIGAGVRPMTAVLAGASAAMALALVAWRALQERRGEATPGRAKLVWSALVLAIPTVLLDGWFYARSQHLYGDPTGSDYLLAKFGRLPRTGPLTIIHADSVWRETLRTMFTRRLENELPTDPLSWWPWVKWGLPLLLLATAVIVVADQVAARRQQRPARTPGQAWAAMVVAVVVVMFLSAQHWSGGGTVHARYLFPALAVLVVTIALPLVRYLTVWSGVALMGIFVAIQARQIPLANDYLNAKVVGRVGSSLTVPIGPPWLRFSGVAMMAVAFVTFIAAIALVPGPDDDESVDREVELDETPA